MRIQELKQQRKALSRQLQIQMHAAYSLTNFSGTSLSLQQLIPTGLPTGTGDCCAPKLLHYAATHHLKPLAMAEFWWGSSSANQDKIQGEFYGACVERCQPLMGFLLSGLKLNPPVGEVNISNAMCDLFLKPLSKPLNASCSWGKPPRPHWLPTPVAHGGNPQDRTGSPRQLLMGETPKTALAPRSGERL